MSDLLFTQLIVLAVGGSIAPPLLLLTVLLLGFQRSLLNAMALVLGYFTVCAAIGVAWLILFSGVVGAVSIASTIGRGMSLIVGSLLIVLGLKNLLLNTPNRAASAARWMESVSSMAPAKAFGIGMALFPIQIKNLTNFKACMNLISPANLSPQGSIVALVVVLLVFAIPVLGIIGLYAAQPHRASNMLGSFREWMQNNNRTITVVLCFVFGVFFLVRGISGS
jgi:hypothetical protein